MHSPVSITVSMFDVISKSLLILRNPSKRARLKGKDGKLFTVNGG